MIPYILIYLTGVFLSSLSQILLKKEADREHGSFLREYLNPRVIIAYGIFFGCTFLTMLAYKEIPMNWGPVLETAGYIFVTVLGVTILREKVTKKKFFALCVILCGILMYAFV
jgi:multidrug transporter EmrE-like cation transporter